MFCLEYSSQKQISHKAIFFDLFLVMIMNELYHELISMGGKHYFENKLKLK